MYICTERKLYNNKNLENMTVKELKEFLEYQDDNVEVRIASNDKYSNFEYSIYDIVQSYDNDDNEVIYIAENQQMGSLSILAKEDLDL